MKYVFLCVVSVCFAFASNAQSTISARKDVRQKKYLDSLQKAFPPPIVQDTAQPKVIQGMPVMPLLNEEETTVINGEDTISTTKKYKMPVMKPNAKTTHIPNAADGKIFMVPPAKKP